LQQNDTCWPILFFGPFAGIILWQYQLIFDKFLLSTCSGDYYFSQFINLWSLFYHYFIR
jgi:hypothetical protein